MTKLIKTAAALALGASLVTTAVVPTDASAASKYKVKSGKLVIAKTGKVATGTITFNKIVYKNGVKLTGLKGKIYYKAGKKATGTYKGAYYVKGAKKVTTGTYNKAYYVKGVKKVTTGIYNKQYFKAGKKATGTYKGAYYVNGVKKVTTGTYNKAYYVKGVKKVATGTYNKAYYVNGVKKATTGTYNKAYYVDGKKVVTTGLYADKLYTEGKLNEGLAKFEDKLYKDADLNKGLIKFEDKYYFDADLANATYELDGKEEAFEKGIIVGAKVASVEAINGTTIEVKFNKAVDKESATAVKDVTDKVSQVVSVEGAELSNPVLSEDGRTLTLNFEYIVTTPATTEFKDATVTVKPVVTKADAKVETPKFVSVLNYKDTVAPTAVSASSELGSINKTTAEEVTVKFSESVKNEGIFYVNGTAVSATQADAKDELILDITSLNAKAGESLEIKLTNVKDIAGNNITPNPVTISTTVKAADTVAPVIESIKTKDDDTVVVTYSKEIATATTDVFLSNGTKELASAATAKVNADNKKEVTYTFSGLTLVDDKLTATLVVPKESVTDTKGNKFAADYTTSVTFANDTTAPTVTNSSFKDGKLVVNFSEEVTVKTGTEAAITLVNAATGAALPKGSVAIEAADLSTDNKTLTISLATLEEGTYKVQLEKGFVTDTSKKHNEVAAFETTITVNAATVEAKEDKDAPVIKTALAQVTGTHAVTFTIEDKNAVSALDFASILDKNNYTFAGKALPAGTTITTDAATTDAKSATVTITLPKTEFATETTGKFTITGLKDVKGNAISEILASTDVTFADGVAPTVKSAFAMVDNTPVIADLTKGLVFTVATGAKTASITVNFDEAVTLAATKVQVSQDGKTFVEYGTVNVSGNTVVITPKAGADTMGTKDATFKLVDDSDNDVTVVKDAKGNELTIPAISVKVAK